jgi:hypothetical protein
MSRAFDQAVSDVKRRRAALTATLEDARARLSPPQLAEEALNLIDPELSLLGRLKARVQHNRLLSLAVLAGVGWLVGAPRRHAGEPPGREAGTTPPRANMKENKNDSGQIHGRHWSGSGAGRQQGRTEERAEAVIVARGRRKAHEDGGLAPLGGEPQRQQPGPERHPLEERQQHHQPEPDAEGGQPQHAEQQRREL